jgi:hypothetical protein
MFLPAKLEPEFEHQLRYHILISGERGLVYM